MMMHTSNIRRGDWCKKYTLREFQQSARQGRRKQFTIGPAQRRIQIEECERSAQRLGGSVGMFPRKVLNFRRSEMESGALFKHGKARIQTAIAAANLLRYE